MAVSIDDAHMAHDGIAATHLVLAKLYANLATGTDRHCLDAASVGASLRTGPYAGLSAIASLITTQGYNVRKRHRQDLGAIAWHARDLLDDQSPFADDVCHAPYQEAYLRLSRTLLKESIMR